ncbi:MAG: FAD-dependent monooxygenase [Candidatus Micrarchaeota archaeon]
MVNVAVIGAGPAGLIAGAYLLKSGFDVTIYEKNKGYLSTPCGEGISERVVQKLKSDIGFDSKPYISSTINGLKNFFPGGFHAFIYEKGHVLNREAWIGGMGRLFEKNGGKVEFDNKIGHIGKLTDEIIVGADGPTSLARQSIGGKVRLSTASQYKMTFPWENKNFLEFYWDLDVSDAYGWNFPKKDYFNVGVMGTFAQLDRFCEKYGFSGKIIKKEAYPIPFSGSAIHKNNVYLIGDAAGMANAFSKGGIAPTVYASEILANCLSSGKGREYEARVKRHPAFSLKYEHALETLISLGSNLEKLGKVVHTQDMLNLPVSTYVKLLRYPHLLGKIRTIRNAFKSGIIYGW